jgi:hypothetical protein
MLTVLLLLFLDTWWIRTIALFTVVSRRTIRQRISNKVKLARPDEYCCFCTHVSFSIRHTEYVLDKSDNMNTRGEYEQCYWCMFVYKTRYYPHTRVFLQTTVAALTHYRHTTPWVRTQVYQRQLDWTSLSTNTSTSRGQWESHYDKSDYHCYRLLTLLVASKPAVIYNPLSSLVAFELAKNSELSLLSFFWRLFICFLIYRNRNSVKKIASNGLFNWISKHNYLFWISR